MTEHKMSPKLTMPSEFRNIVICALRYARTVDSSLVTEFVIKGAIDNWDWLNDNDRLCIRKDTVDATNDRLGGTTFKEEWIEFFLWICQSEQSIRRQPTRSVWGLGFLTAYALKYCVGRQSYMPSLIIDGTKQNWELLNQIDRQTIQRDVNAMIGTRYLGMDCDRDTWLSFDKWITEKMK